MKSVSSAGADAAARKRATVETYAQNEGALRRTARRFSLCEDDANDALQRALEILLRKAPTEDPRELVKWMQKVVKHEALAIRRDRERILAGPAAASAPGSYDWVALLPADSDGPAERAERREAIARSREALRTLKPQELRALTLLAEGYSYAEIGEITGFSQTKINRCLAEGRERFRRLVARSEDGSRCAEMRPLISAFCDGEAAPTQVSELREHLRACAHCRATLRAYRAAPAAAAALAPALPLGRSLFERVHDAFAELTTRFGGSGGEAAASSVSAGSGAGSVGVLAKVATICLGAAGGAACVATGVVSADLEFGSEHTQTLHLESRRLDPRPVKDEPAAEGVATDRTPQEKPISDRQAREEPGAVANETGDSNSAEAVEYEPPQSEPVVEPEPVPAPVATSGSDSPAGEFGP